MTLRPILLSLTPSVMLVADLSNLNRSDNRFDYSIATQDRRLDTANGRNETLLIALPRKARYDNRIDETPRD